MNKMNNSSAVDIYNMSPQFSKKYLKLLDGFFFRPRVGSKPEPRVFGDVEISPFKFDSPGAVCISADFELAWAWAHSEPEYMKQAGNERKYVPDIIDALEHHDVPITWATVGHLFLDSCIIDRKSGKAHPDMPRPEHHYKNNYWSWEGDDWYENDPCTDLGTDNLWYCPDLIEKIIKSRVDHEMGSHTFSHVDFSDVNCDTDLASAEVRKSREVMKKYGLIPRSMVFPGGFWGNLDTLSKEGIITFRRKEKVDISYPVRTEHGLWNIVQSLFLFGDLYTSKPIRYMIKAMDNNAVCHFAFHPSKLGKEQMEKVFIPILKFADENRKAGRLWIATMSEIANYCEAREKTVVESRLNGNDLEITIKHDVDLERYDLSNVTLKVKIPDKKEVSSVKVGNKNLKMGSRECFIKEQKDRFLILTVPIDSKSMIIDLG